METTDDLEKDLLRLVKSDDDNEFKENVDRAIQILQTLQRSSSLIGTSTVRFCPQEFNCPLSKDMMSDPVIVSTGTTYDRSSIQNWLKEGNVTCPITKQLLSHTNLIPNQLVRDMISQWCKNRGIRYPVPEHYLIIESLERMLSSTILAEEKEAASVLRSLTGLSDSYAASFGEFREFIPPLLTPLTDPQVHPDLEVDLMMVLFNIAAVKSNKEVVANTSMVIPILLESLRKRRNETTTIAAGTLSSLSDLSTTRSLIGKAGALKVLLNFLEKEDLTACDKVISTIFSLCLDNGNKRQAMQDGAVGVILDRIKERKHVDKLLDILVMLSYYHTGAVEMVNLGGGSSLLSLIKETDAKGKEKCITVLQRMCLKDKGLWEKLREEDEEYRTISNIAKTGTTRAKTLAKDILDRIVKL